MSPFIVVRLRFSADSFFHLAGLVVEPPAVPGAVPHAGLAVGGGFVDPKSFLLAVMNDPGATAEHRIEAAKALLPYFP